MRLCLPFTQRQEWMKLKVVRAKAAFGLSVRKLRPPAPLMLTLIAFVSERHEIHADLANV